MVQLQIEINSTYEHSTREDPKQEIALTQQITTRIYTSNPRFGRQQQTIKRQGNRQPESTAARVKTNKSHDDGTAST